MLLPGLGWRGLGCPLKRVRALIEAAAGGRNGHSAPIPAGKEVVRGLDPTLTLVANSNWLGNPAATWAFTRELHPTRADSPVARPHPLSSHPDRRW